MYHQIEGVKKYNFFTTILTLDSDPFFKFEMKIKNIYTKLVRKSILSTVPTFKLKVQSEVGFLVKKTSGKPK